MCRSDPTPRCEIVMVAIKAILALFILFQGVGVVLAETPILVNAKNQVPAYTTVERLHSFIKIRNPDFDPLHGDFSNIAGTYEYWGRMYGIRWDYALFQMLHETNFLMFTGGVKPEHFNLAGIGATVGLLLGTAAKMAIAFAMIGVFLFARFL